ncbi:hypothetical protein RB195_010468 [Necator americanus]|uniref:Endonuclease/exonuclease/phosphatase domain-containing protein n=1 Tax=Necator americanus TaxID=51031 RepID=A0ABR1CZW6_NECAM
MKVLAVQRERGPRNVISAPTKTKRCTPKSMEENHICEVNAIHSVDDLFVAVMLAVCQSVLLIFTTHEERRVLLRAKYASFLSLAISTADEKARKQQGVEMFPPTGYGCFYDSGSVGSIEGRRTLFILVRRSRYDIRSRPKKLVRQQQPVRLATLNVGTLTGRSCELADSLRKRRVDICCVQETRWKGSKSRELGDGYKLIYHDTSNRNGVSIILNESFRNSVTVVDRLSDRLTAAKVDTGEVELRVVSAYAPQAGCSEEEKASFWEDLEQYVRSLEGEEVLLIGGDFNGHVGSRKDGFESCHGGYGYGARNDDGLRILEYAVASDLIIANTQYRKRKSHLTYTSGGRETQIDFWMLRRRDRRLLQDSKVIPTDHVTAQHHLLVTDLKIYRPRKRHPRTEIQRIKWWNLKNRKEVFFA